MTPQREMVEQIFEAALSINPMERDLFLQSACRNDSRLKVEVEALLAEAAKAGSFLQHSPLSSLGDIRATPSKHASQDTRLHATGTSIGAFVGHFKILEKIGSGGMGVVYRAQDLALDRVVALKSLPPALVDNQEATARLFQEAKTASILDHPNICTIYQVLQTREKQVFIAMCYYEGETISQKLRYGPLPETQALRIAVDVAHGLEKAHRHGVVHRDIKPGNIMVTSDGTVKILDFGLATLASLSALWAGKIVGTIDYMSPEQLRGEQVDERTDIWAWGVVLFEMITGRVPFECNGHLLSRFDDLPEFAELAKQTQETLPEGVAGVLARALRKNPLDRYPKISDALSELKRCCPSMSDSRAPRQLDVSRRPNPSIAVLPFQNLSSNPDDEYFGHGLNEELTDALSRLDGLQVASKTSVFALNGTGGRAETAARLGVAFVLEGSVRRAGNRLRISVQLVNVHQEAVLWAERFDREISDIFTVQEEIAAHVANKLKVHLSKDHSAELVKRYTHNQSAYNLYLKGRYQWNRESPESLFNAVETLRQATEADPRYVSPFCGLAECYLVMGARALLSPGEAWSKARDASNSALSLDPLLADAHGCLGAVLAINDFDWAGAEQEFRRGLELNPDSALTRHWYAISLLAPRGRLNEALAETTRAIECEPLSLIYNSTLAWIYYLSGKWGQAAEQCAKTLEIDPHHFDSLWCLAAAYHELDKIREGLAILKKLDEISGGIPIVYGSLGHGHGKLGEVTEAETMLSAVQECARKIYSSPICESWIHANLPGHETQALDCLERAHADRDFMVRYIHLSPALTSLSGHPRFQALVGAMNLQKPQGQSLGRAAATASAPSLQAARL